VKLAGDSDRSERSEPTEEAAGAGPARDQPAVGGDSERSECSEPTEEIARVVHRMWRDLGRVTWL
jgi:hypothetical protein